MPEYDYVIVGAGAAGCVLANRLSARGASVCLLESGGSDRHLGVRAPAAFPTLFQTTRDWNLLSEPEPGLHGRRWYLPRGRMIGGSSSMNAMFYVRGHRSDFDRWVEDFGATGWGYDDVLPLFRRSERNEDFHDEFHGTSGELNVTRRRWLSSYWRPFVDAAAAAGIERVDDYNGARMDGASLVQITTRRGRRHSAADAFLKPVRRRENLTVETGAHVRRILVENGRAVGVDHAKGTARAAREVIVAAGAYGSPQLLMLSGIGPAEQLREHGIEVLVDNANVGRHLQEHPMLFVNWRVDGDTLDDADDPRHLLPWLVAGRGKLSSNVAEAVVHWRSDPSLPAPDFQLVQAAVYFWEHGFRKTGAPAFTIGASYLGPRSRGAVTLRSADPGDHPRVLNNALTSDGEVDAMLRALDMVREIASQRPLRDLLGEELNPSSGIRTREQLVDWLRATCEHEYHPSCTCRIGPPEEGVVDAELRVHGVEGLRVADASVQPRIVSANTQAVTLMIAERCSDLLLAPAGARPAVAVA
ncbi:MAG TPA: FAD-dependent oxidoreductase [Thermoleophilaceae bacterium]|jgi:choline dehydrogenase